MMSHYDNYSREQLLQRIEDLERRCRTVTQLNDIIARQDDRLRGMQLEIRYKDNKIKSLQFNINGLQDRLAKYVVVEVLEKAS